MSARWAWIQLFANRLLQLEPTCPESIAVAVGAIAYDTDFGELPQHAAETHAAGSSIPGVAGRLIRHAGTVRDKRQRW